VNSVGVDLDGVLADQVTGVLPRILDAYGIDLTYEDVTHWRLPLGSTTDIAKEIVAAQEDRDYVLTMAVHPGAQEMLKSLRARYRIVVLTARAGDALEWSVEWLHAKGLYFDEIAGSKEAKKSLHGVDALVDDYLGNVEEFLTNATGPAVLVDQPWNRDGRDVLDAFPRRVSIVTSLRDVPKALAGLAR
jgi:5'(3')-deoxyribonucleotidase